MSWQTQARKAGWHSKEEWKTLKRNFDEAMEGYFHFHDEREDCLKKIADLERQLAEAKSGGSSTVEPELTQHPEKDVCKNGDGGSIPLPRKSATAEPKPKGLSDAGEFDLPIKEPAAAEKCECRGKRYLLHCKKCKGLHFPHCKGGC